MVNPLYQQCATCVMDTTDPLITFDEHGICHYCQSFETKQKPFWHPDEEGQKRLQTLIQNVKEAGKGQEYDCIIGLSGGIDSAYLTLKSKEWGLRPLCLHVDAGWNTELAVYNIEKIIKYCGYDLYTHVVDWEEMKDIQLSFLKAGVPNQDVPQDHAFASTLYHFATKNNIRYILSGGNIATESVPISIQHSCMDARNLLAIHRAYSSKKLKNYKTINIFDYYFYYPFVKKMRTLRPLNFMPYIKDKAIQELKEKVGYKEYSHKHGESVFTKFFQNYYLIHKYDYDKRKPHYASLILSGQMTRDEALKALQEPLYKGQELQQDKEYIAKKLDLSLDEFESILEKVPHEHADFANNMSLFELIRRLKSYLSKMNVNVKVYS